MNVELRKNIKKRQQLENLVDVTFYVPCCNEEHNIIPTLKKIVSVLDHMDLTYELLIYNDGSMDKTQYNIDAYIRKHRELFIRVVHNKKRRGLGFNYIEGAFLGVGKYYMMICGDNSETEESIRKVLRKMGDSDIIIPYFGSWDTRNFYRRNLSRMFTTIVNLINGYHIKYYNGTVLHLRRNVMRWHPASSGFAYQAELLSILLDHQMTYTEVNISNNDRTSGISKAFSIQNYFSVSHSMLQIFFSRVRRMIWPIVEK